MLFRSVRGASCDIHGSEGTGFSFEIATGITISWLQILRRSEGTGFSFEIATFVFCPPLAGEGVRSEGTGFSFEIATTSTCGRSSNDWQ